MGTLKRYNGSSFVDISQMKRYNGSSFVDVTSCKKWNGSAWVQVYPNITEVQMHAYDRVGLIGDGPYILGTSKYMSLQYDTNMFYAPASLSGKIRFTNNKAIEYVFIKENNVTVNDIDYFANVYIDFFYTDKTSTSTFAGNLQKIFPNSAKTIDYVYIHSVEYSESTDWTFDIQIQLNPNYIVTDTINE